MTDTDKRIAQIGVLPVIQLNDPEENAAPLAEALCEGGLPAAEVTFRAPRAEAAIRAMKAACPHMLVGAGTVLTKKQADQAMEAGAQFIVLPGFEGELVAYCQKKNIPVYPGCSTPTDYHAALKYGLKILKFFPAEQSGGLAKIRAMSAPFPMFQIMPTGGIHLGNLKEYLSCPVVAACGGSYMAPAGLVNDQKWDEIMDLCRKSAAIVREVRSI